MPPTDRRVGALDHPERYDRNSVAVRQNSLGFYIKLDGCREKVHGAQLWTSTSGVKMRGALPLGAPPRRAAHAAAWGDDSDDDSDDSDLAAAIAASLAEASQAVYGPPVEEGDGGAPDGEDAAPEGGDAATADERPNDATGGGCGTSGGSSGATCVVCLTEPAVMLMRPCNHVCGCAGCARRLVRRPCPLCRKLVAKTERVFF